MFRQAITITITRNIKEAYYYYYYYYVIYLNCLLLLLLLLRHMFRQAITITITRNIKEAYYYYYYFPDYYYYFPITIKFIIAVEPKKHNPSRLQSNFQRHLLLLLYHTLPQTHYHRYYHYKTKLKILWRYTEAIGKVIVYYWQMHAPITITITTTSHI